MKVVYLAIEQAAKKWTMPIRDWKPALNQFMILYKRPIYITALGHYAELCIMAISIRSSYFVIMISTKGSLLD